MPHGKADTRNLLLVSPGKVQEVAVLDTNFVEGFGSWSDEWRGCGLVEEYIQV
jgi:hypothetical protein